MNLKLLLYPAASIAVLFLILFLALQRWQITITIDSLPSEENLLVEPSPDKASVTTATVSTESNPKPTATLIAPLKNKPTQAPSSARGAVAAPPGVLRLSNQTEHPIRIAFLARQKASKSGKQSAYGEPAHWDFAPEEGAEKGLILSLPTGFVKLEEGDILIAFAQDGTRRYWGPYVVGVTAMPIWDRKTLEWQLILQP
ncbi:MULTISPECIES: hypothetical protein [Aerosakkonema]|uniref:hypothetical protein n=1 Tax=Aerosakkonema TaxID=1246629 RepID=UPI0035B84296